MIGEVDVGEDWPTDERADGERDEMTIGEVGGMVSSLVRATCLSEYTAVDRGCVDWEAAPRGEVEPAGRSASSSPSCSISSTSSGELSRVMSRPERTLRAMFRSAVGGRSSQKRRGH